jgi:hypothetical protein
MKNYQVATQRPAGRCCQLITRGNFDEPGASTFKHFLRCRRSQLLCGI